MHLIIVNYRVVSTRRKESEEGRIWNGSMNNWVGIHILRAD